MKLDVHNFYQTLVHLSSYYVVLNILQLIMDGYVYYMFKLIKICMDAKQECQIKKNEWI